MKKILGKMVVANDASTLSNLGFEKSPDAAIFAKNIANWFTGGRPGKFHSYADPKSKSESALAETMTKAGHTWTVGYKVPENVDAIFTSEISIEDEKLRDLLLAGGNIYLAAETENENYASGYSFNWFLVDFGLQFNKDYNGISGNQPINSDRPIFAGVKSLYQRNGTSVINFQPQEPANQILVSKDGQGLYGILDLANASTRVRISRIFSDGTVNATEADEYIVIVNDGLLEVDMSGWRVHAVDRNQDFTFPAGTILGKGSKIRVYTNEVHPESGGFSFGSKRSIWNNKADEGRLYDDRGNLVSSYAYTEHSQKLANLMFNLDTPAYRLDNETLILEADPAAIKAQKALGGKIGFEEAVGLAYECFAYYDEEESSGSAQETIGAHADAVGTPYRYFVDGETFPSSWYYLQKPNIKITLCTPETPTQPTRGESIEANWIFMLKVPELNTIHWAIVDRTGEKEAYNYGRKLS